MRFPRRTRPRPKSRHRRRTAHAIDDVRPAGPRSRSGRCASSTSSPRCRARGAPNGSSRPCPRGTCPTPRPRRGPRCRRRSSPAPPSSAWRATRSSFPTECSPRFLCLSGDFVDAWVFLLRRRWWGPVALGSLGVQGGWRVAAPLGPARGTAMSTCTENRRAGRGKSPGTKRAKKYTP